MANKSAEEQREWRAERKRLGLCRSCKKKAKPGKTMCRQCLAKAVRDRTKCARAKVANGLCRECTTPSLPGMNFCAKHRARMRYWVNKRAKELDALGICKCGQRLKAVGYALCAPCTLARRVHRPAHAHRGAAPIQLCECGRGPAIVGVGGLAQCAECAAMPAPAAFL